MIMIHIINNAKILFHNILVGCLSFSTDNFVDENKTNQSAFIKCSSGTLKCENFKTYCF